MFLFSFCSPNWIILKWTIFKSTNSFFSQFKSTAEPLHWIFHFSYCVFQLRNFHLVVIISLLIFSIWWNTVTLSFIKHGFLQRFKYTCDYFEVFIKSDIWSLTGIACFPLSGSQFSVSYLRFCCCCWNWLFLQQLWCWSTPPLPASCCHLLFV